MLSVNNTRYSRKNFDAMRDAKSEALRAIAEAHSENDYYQQSTRKDIRIHFDVTNKTAYITDWQNYDVFCPHVGIVLSKNIFRELHAFFANNVPKKKENYRTEYKIDVGYNDFKVISDAFDSGRIKGNNYQYFQDIRREYYYWLYDFLYEQIGEVHSLSFNHTPLIRLK